MNISLSVNQTELLDVLLNVAVTRPVFIWGAPIAFCAKGESIPDKVKGKIKHVLSIILLLGHP